MSLDELQEQVERIYVDMENELLLNIAKKLSTGKPMEIDKWDEINQQPLVGSGEVNEWQLQRLKELNGLNEENAKIIAKYSGKTIEEVNKVFDRAKEIGVTRDEATIEKGIQLGILNQIDPVIEKPIVQGILTTAIQEVLTTFNKQNNSLLASAGSEYVDIVNKVSSQVLAGTKTTNKAMQEAVSQLAEKGLTGFTARNGAQWTPEAYTKMLLRANTQNTINHIQEERIQSCGGDFIEISSHVGARPLCSQDQGQIFSLSGYSGYIEDLDGGKVKVRPWSSSTYGEPAGILGINCGHSRYMFVPGVSKKREMDFTKKENDDAYIEKQRQRQYERNIRNKKREIAMLKQTGAESSYIKRKQNSLSNIRKEYLEFLNKTGRTRITANEWIGSSTIAPKTKEKTLFKDNIVIRDFDKLDKTVENLIIYDSKSKKRKIIETSNSRNSVGGLKSLMILKTSKTNSLVAVHNHPSNTSFSLTDIETFNRFKSISTIIVKTDNYLYYLEKNGIRKLNEKQLSEYIKVIRKNYEEKYGKTNKAYHLTNVEISKRIGWKYGRQKI